MLTSSVAPTIAIFASSRTTNGTGKTRLFVSMLVATSRQIHRGLSGEARVRPSKEHQGLFQLTLCAAQLGAKYLASLHLLL